MSPLNVLLNTYTENVNLTRHCEVCRFDPIFATLQNPMAVSIPTLHAELPCTTGRPMGGKGEDA